ncbi:MAG: PLD-like domain protein [Magnetococcales bacterium]|nr:PLD-like domain protein [Magnetococcales bacterium]MBF0115782.1 PLD-like domain protein [Magnetococcales bacterium]
MTTFDDYKLRRIFKSVGTSRNVVNELITLMFLAELVDPGPEVWIVSPWISDVPLLDNRAGSFNAVNPGWGRREIRLSDVAVQLMLGGNRLIIVTRPDEHNKIFLHRLEDAVAETDLTTALEVIVRDKLHTKGILTRRGLLLGSMNLTYNGLELNDEVVEYDIDPANLADARLAFGGYRDGKK